MKILVQENLYKRSRNIFDAGSYEWIVAPFGSFDEMMQANRNGARVLIIGADDYPEGFYRRLDEGSLIIRYGGGYDKVPIDICLERNILVANTPGTLDQSVAEQAAALMLALARNTAFSHFDVKQGAWAPRAGVELSGKTLAILGFGRIGSTFAKIAKHGFGMKINAFDILPEPHPSVRDVPDFYTTQYKDAVANADFVSLHIAVTPETEGFINKMRLQQMKKGSCIINTARGALINEDDLYDALLDGQLAGAALDVFINEPYVPVSKKDLTKLDNVLITPHIGSNTLDANNKIAEACLANIKAFEDGRHSDITLVKEML